MATLTVHLPDDVKSLAEARAAQAGCADVGEYLARLVRGEAAGGPAGLAVDADDALESLLLGRLCGTPVEMDAADFQQMRQKLDNTLGPDRGPKP